jgi:hypothetical protein
MVFLTIINDNNNNNKIISVKLLNIMYHKE